MRVIDSLSSPNISVQADEISVTDGFGLMKNIIILGNPGDHLVIDISYNSERWYTSASLYIELKTCSRGEFFLNRMISYLWEGFEPYRVSLK